MNAQHDNGLLPQMTVQNLAALAAMTQPMQAAQQPSAQLSNAAALLCKYFIIHFLLVILKKNRD